MASNTPERRADKRLPTSDISPANILNTRRARLPSHRYTTASPSSTGTTASATAPATAQAKPKATATSQSNAGTSTAHAGNTFWLAAAAAAIIAIVITIYHYSHQHQRSAAVVQSSSRTQSTTIITHTPACPSPDTTIVTGFCATAVGSTATQEQFCEKTLQCRLDMLPHTAQLVWQSVGTEKSVPVLGKKMDEERRTRATTPTIATAAPTLLA